MNTGDWVYDELLPCVTTLAADAEAQDEVFRVASPIFRVGDVCRFEERGYEEVLVEGEWERRSLDEAFVVIDLVKEPAVIRVRRAVGVRGRQGHAAGAKIVIIDSGAAGRRGPEREREVGAGGE